MRRCWRSTERVEPVSARRALMTAVVALLTLTTCGVVGLTAAQPAIALSNTCGPPVTSVIACENTQPGDPAADWQVSGVGDSSIQGYATAMSVNKGETITFKVNTPSK